MCTKAKVLDTEYNLIDKLGYIILDTLPYGNTK